jgi:hypothetical protein
VPAAAWSRQGARGTQRELAARVALGVGVTVRARLTARLDLDRVQRHAGDDQPVVVGDVIGEDGLVAERERDGMPVQFDDLDLSQWRPRHHGPDGRRAIARVLVQLLRRVVTNAGRSEQRELLVAFR